MAILGAGVGASAQVVDTGTAEAMTRAQACESALNRAGAGKFSFLESINRIAKVEKRCECDKVPNAAVERWSCMGYVAYVERN